MHRRKVAGKRVRGWSAGSKTEKKAEISHLMTLGRRGAAFKLASTLIVPALFRFFMFILTSSHENSHEQGMQENTAHIKINTYTYVSCLSAHPFKHFKQTSPHPF
jgi:hypothetical protein